MPIKFISLEPLFTFIEKDTIDEVEFYKTVFIIFAETDMRVKLTSTENHSMSF